MPLTSYNPVAQPSASISGDFTPPIGYVFVGYDTAVRTFTVPTNLAYGVNGTFYFKKNVTGTITFDNATFGDPVRFARKGGFAEVTAANQVEIDKIAADALAATSGMSATTKWLLYGGIGAVALIITALIIRMARKKK